MSSCRPLSSRVPSTLPTPCPPPAPSDPMSAACKPTATLESLSLPFCSLSCCCLGPQKVLCVFCNLHSCCSPCCSLSLSAVCSCGLGRLSRDLSLLILLTLVGGICSVLAGCWVRRLGARPWALPSGLICCSGLYWAQAPEAAPVSVAGGRHPGPSIFPDHTVLPQVARPGGWRMGLWLRVKLKESSLVAVGA